MSLMIDTSKVSHVLLADGWHDVNAATFDIDAYEFGEANPFDTLLTVCLLTVRGLLSFRQGGSLVAYCFGL